MLGLFSNKSAHPLAEAREASRVLEEIASSEPLAAIEQAIACVESVGGDDGFKPAQRLNLLLKLDEAAASGARRLCRDYPLQSRSRAQEARIWELGHGYSLQLVTSYLFCLTSYRCGEKDAEAIRPQLPLLYARLINAMGSNLKWDQFHYVSGDPDFWGTLGSIYLAAVEAGLAQTSLPLYASAADTTIEAEYLKVLVFQSSSMDTLTPLQMEIAERLIVHFPSFLCPEPRGSPRKLVLGRRGQAPAADAHGQSTGNKPDLASFFNGLRAVDAVVRTIGQLTKRRPSAAGHQSRCPV